MSYFRRTLPSLDALVFFEAAARFENFTHAAAELRVSQVAVSKRVHALERQLGVVLFERAGRNLALTEAGRSLAERSRAGLSFLEEAVVTARNGARRIRPVIQIAANENINFFWLSELVRAYQMSGNDAVVSVVTANNVADVVRAETDVAIFHGKAPPDGWHARPLFDEVIAPVASPAYRRRMLAGADAELVLLDYRKEAPEWVNWETLALGKSDRRFARARRHLCSSYIQSISLALEGRGVGLGVLPMLDRELSENKLVLLDTPPLKTGYSYFLCTPAGRPRSRDTEDLILALINAAAAARIA